MHLWDNLDENVILLEEIPKSTVRQQHEKAIASAELIVNGGNRTLCEDGIPNPKEAVRSPSAK